MIKKVIFILVIFFSIQLLFSCILCDCNDPATYEINYNAVSITPYNTAGFTNVIVNDSVYKNAFGIEVQTYYDIVKINAISPKFVLGFNTLMACSCEDDTYNYPDPISYVEIFVIDTKTNEKTNVSINFKIPTYYNDELISLEQFFQERENWQDVFQFQLVDFETIPNSSIFVVEVYLKSGITFTNQTEEVNFYH